MKRAAPRLRLRGTLASLCLAVLAAALIAAGCGGGGEHHGHRVELGRPAPQQVVVESSSGGFNPAQIYKDVAPGVVTIPSVFGDGGDSASLGGGRGRPGLGLRPQQGRRDRHQRPRGHRGGDRRRRTPKRRSRSTSSSLTATGSPAKSSASTRSPTSRCIKVDPDGLDLQPCSSRDRSTLHGRRAGGGDRQPVRRGPVPLRRRDLGDRPLRRVAHPVRDRQRDPDRRRRSTPATPAGRCSTPRAR